MVLNHCLGHQLASVLWEWATVGRGQILWQPDRHSYAIRSSSDGDQLRVDIEGESHAYAPGSWWVSFLSIC